MQHNHELDFFSEHFNPLKALETPELQPPLANIKARDHIDRCRSLLHPSDENYRAAVKRKQPPPSTEEKKVVIIEEKKLPMELPRISRFNSECHIPKSIAYQTSNNNMYGPLLLLKELYNESCRIHVCIRRAVSIRGWCEGTLVAFDRHMNLILLDVYEEHDDDIRRHVNQLFIRGDNVVLIYRVA